MLYPHVDSGSTGGFDRSSGGGGQFGGRGSERFAIILCCPEAESAQLSKTQALTRLLTRKAVVLAAALAAEVRLDITKGVCRSS